MDVENNIKQILKEGGYIEDETMSKKEMMDLQEAINNSKDTASLEEEKREYVRKAEELQKQPVNNAASKSDSDKSVKLRQKSRSVTPDLFDFDTDVETSQKEFDITFHDMPKRTNESLDIIYHDPVYELSIPHNPKYQKYSIQQRTKLLDDYFTKVSQAKYRLAKKSLHRAPYSKPILPSNKCKNSLLNGYKDEDEAPEESFEPSPPEQFYVSRAGRQIKRKIYTEDAENDDSDFEGATSSKKNKILNSDTKITLDTPFVQEENHIEEKNPARPKTKKDSPAKRPTFFGKKMGRTESIFQKLKSDEEKKKQQQKEIDDFEKTLSPIEEIEDDRAVAEVSAEVSEENFVRKRVVPPIPGRRPLRTKKQQSSEDFDAVDVLPNSAPSSPVILKQYSSFNRSFNQSSPKVSKLKDSSSEQSSDPKLEKTPCPICNKQFLLSEIENHAANCGIDEDIEDFPENITQSSMLKCELCEQEFEANTNYEVHVKQCIAKKVTDL